MDVSQQESGLAFYADSPKAQELLARAYALLNNSGLRAGLLKTFGKDLVEQIIGILCFQYLLYAAVAEGMDDSEGWDGIIDKFSPEMLDRHSGFVSFMVVFWDSDKAYNFAKHPVNLKELDFGENADPEDSELIKLIVFMFNQHSVSDVIYEKLSEANKELQLSKILHYATAYLDHCQENGMVSLYNIIMNQAWLIGLKQHLTSTLDKEKDESKGVTQ